MQTGNLFRLFFYELKLRCKISTYSLSFIFFALGLFNFLRQSLFFLGYSVFCLSYLTVLFVDYLFMFGFKLKKSFFCLKYFFLSDYFSLCLGFTYYFTALVS